MLGCAQGLSMRMKPSAERPPGSYRYVKQSGRMPVRLSRSWRVQLPEWVRLHLHVTAFDGSFR